MWHLTHETVREGAESGESMSEEGRLDLALGEQSTLIVLICSFFCCSHYHRDLNHFRLSLFSPLIIKSKIILK